MRYFHGALRRLETGGLLLPPSVTKVQGCSTVDAAYSAHRNDRVYLTTYYDEAAMYAMTAIQPQPAVHQRRYAGRGWIYEAEPIGIVELDEDYTIYGLSTEELKNYICCASDRLVAEYRPSWDMLALRCVRQMIEDQNQISLYNDFWPRCKEDLVAA